MRKYVDSAAPVVRRWKTTLSVPADADDVRAAAFIRSAMINAAEEASKFDGPPFYPNDNSWSHDGIRGLTRERMSEEVEAARDSMAKAPEHWGIVGVVVLDDIVFHVPIAIDLEESAALNILARMRGMEEHYVDVNAIAHAFPERNVRLALVADNWGELRDQARHGAIDLDVAMDFRRPVVWDMLRARLSELPPEPLRAFDEEEFYSIFARSSRYDAALMQSTRSMVRKVAMAKADPLTPRWGEWFPAVCDMLSMIGAAQPIDGISIVLNFAVEEIVTGSSDERPEWAAVGFHNTLVCYGLHPLAAVSVMDVVRADPYMFFDLPMTAARRHRLVGVSAAHDSMLASLRVSLTGRTDIYDRMVAAERASATLKDADATDLGDAVPF